MDMNAGYYIEQLNLSPHPEGGYYKETYRSKGKIRTELMKGIVAERNFCTAIYFLLEKNNFSAFHRIKSDELWHFYAGDALEVVEITKQGELKITVLGPHLDKGQVFQYMVPAGNWFGSRLIHQSNSEGGVKKGGEFSLVGCTVSPGFDFLDFEMGNREELIEKYPAHEKIIKELTRTI